MLDFLAPLWNLVIYNPMVNVLLLLYSVFQNYGVAIILFTLLIALITAPLRIKSQLAMREQQAKTARLKPRLDELKKKYKDNTQQYQAAQMKLYQEEGLVNPLNSGCLLSLLPFPIFIGLYNVIITVMGDRPEQLMQLSPHLYSFLPYLARLVPVNPYFFGLNLASTVSAQNPILIAVIVGLVVGASYLQQKMMMQPAAALDPQQAQMNQSMQLMTPLLFGFFVFNYQIGLSLYWITFSLVGIVQQYFTTGLGGLAPQPAAPAKAQPKKVSPPVSDSRAPSNGSEDGREKAPAAPAAAQPKSKKGKRNRANKS
jgi:YidC/Oxa1 family membrane protein insertase